MKILLACLMCLVLGASECVAIDGGPVFGGGRGVTVTGTYAGVFVPIPIVVDPGPPRVTLTENSLVLFTLSIPKVGLASGTTAVFRNGLFYPGTIQGSADPDTARLTGIINAVFEVTSSESMTASITARFTANGRFVNARIAARTTASNVATTRIGGKASLTYTCICSSSSCSVCDEQPGASSGEPVVYKIHGFKQSEASG
jgi:hypothetical protein